MSCFPLSLLVTRFLHQRSTHVKKREGNCTDPTWHNRPTANLCTNENISESDFCTRMCYNSGSGNSPLPEYIIVAIERPPTFLIATNQIWFFFLSNIYLFILFTDASPVLTYRFIDQVKNHSFSSICCRYLSLLQKRNCSFKASLCCSFDKLFFHCFTTKHYCTFSLSSGIRRPSSLALPSP